MARATVPNNHPADGVSAANVVPPDIDRPAADGNASLLRQIMFLALPVFVEHTLHTLVSMTDSYLANHLSKDAAEATAAVGTITYLFWFIGLFAGAVGTGSTAIVARAIGARHRGAANRVVGQSILFALVLGSMLGIVLYAVSDPLARAAGLSDVAAAYAAQYLRIISPAVPMIVTLFVANACLRGSGDTVTPATAMFVVDVVNAVLSFSLVYGWMGLPEIGFAGIAIGTLVAYICGAMMQIVVLLMGRKQLRLYLHRLRPNPHDLRRIIRIGLPSGLEGAIMWTSNFFVLRVVNSMDVTSIAGAAHNTTIRIEALSYMSGYAFAVAASTIVGQSLGMKRPTRAVRAAYLCYLVGGGLMTLLGLLFIAFPHVFAALLTEPGPVADLTAQTLRITGVCQIGFAAQIIFGGALRGAGDTLWAMLLNLSSVVLIRLAGVLVVGAYLGWGLGAVWWVLVVDLMLRGGLMFARFAGGRWKTIKV